MLATSVEQLPVELWLQIFSFIEAHHLIKAFSGLNSFIDSILLSPHLRIHFKVLQDGCQDVSVHGYIYPSNINAIEVLSAGKRYTGDLLCSLDTTTSQVLHLRVLDIYIYRRVNFRVNILIRILPRLNQLEILSLNSRDTWNNTFRIHALLEEIIKLPRLRECNLSFATRPTNRTYKTLIINPSLRHITIDAPVDPNYYINLLKSAPAIRSLVLNTHHWERSIEHDFCLSRLTKMVYKSTFVQFGNMAYFVRAAPKLVSLHIDAEASASRIQATFFKYEQWLDLLNNHPRSIDIKVTLRLSGDLEDSYSSYAIDLQEVFQKNNPLLGIITFNFDYRSCDPVIRLLLPFFPSEFHIHQFLMYIFENIN